MILFLQAKTSIPDLVIDFIEIQLRSGQTVSLTWDETEQSNEDEIFTAKYKGVYFDENPANGRVSELIGMQVEHVEFYSESDSVGTFSIQELRFVDDEKVLSFTEPIYR